ncbi:MAG: zinc ribbon domain-containing protein [Candidatus Poseidoniales archaeon]|nr:zinc ribbon domain-containing protein [Candidatus Poseidoniales archaeon]
MAGEKNQLNAWVLFAAPIFVFMAIYQLIPAISERLITDWIGLAIYLAVAVLIGFFLFRNSRTIRDHEWHRSKHIKRLQKDYAAEDRGVWSKADLAMAELEADARGIEMGQMSQKALQRLDGSIAELTGDRLTSEIENKDTDHDNVALFSESEHVRRSTARVTGETGPVESVQGVTHAHEVPEKGLISGVLDKLKETSVQSLETVESTPVQETEGAADDWYAQEMRGVGTAGPSSATPTRVGNTCGSCGQGNPESEAYCENCGNKL